MAIMRRGKQFSIRRRVPLQYASVEHRVEIWLSLNTDSETVAKQKEPLIWGQQIEVWEARLAGDSKEAQQRHDAAQRLAKARGFRYLTADKVAELPRDELLARVEAVAAQGSAPAEAAALLGGVVTPKITIKHALELYWDLARDRVKGKSEDQIRRWKNPRIKAIGNLVEVIGDKAIADITGSDMLDFREWWLDRIQEEELSNDSANKDLTHLGVVLKTVNQLMRLELALPMSGLKLMASESKPRLPFSDGWIRDRLLAPGALQGLNEEAVGIMLTMVNTGARPSELACLTPAEIHLDEEIPFLSIKAIGRQLKSKNAIRSIPLMGVSLEAMKAFSTGFPRYRAKPATVSGTVNKFLRENGLKETPEHTLYGLRHAIEDRMLAAGVDERIRRDVMGHSLGRERYGQGGSLKQVKTLLQPISF